LLWRLLSGLKLTSRRKTAVIGIVGFVQRQTIATGLVESGAEVALVVDLDDTILDVDVNLASYEVHRERTVFLLLDVDHAVGLDRTGLAPLPTKAGKAVRRFGGLPEEVVPGLEQRFRPLDVDSPSGQLVGKPGILAFFTN